MFSTLKNLFGFGSKINLSELIQNGATIVDVRTPGEFSRRHVKGSLNIPLDKLAAQSSKLKGKKPLIMCCASGMRSATATSLLKSKGFEDVYNGGSWTNVNRHI